MSAVKGSKNLLGIKNNHPTYLIIIVIVFFLQVTLEELTDELIEKRIRRQHRDSWFVKEL